MNFKIKQIILWPKKESFPPRILYFDLDKVNVITGSSRTGKSAIIPIIDYCLGAGDCLIPIDVIRNTVAWYGLVISLDDSEILIAREICPDGKSSTKYYYEQNRNIDVPIKIEGANDVLSNVKMKLNDIAHLMQEGLSEESIGFDSHISFRDLTHLCFQSQDVIANQSILFYKTHKVEHKEKLKRWMPYILGAETRDSILYDIRLKEIRKKLRKLKKELSDASRISDQWIENAVFLLEEIQKYGLKIETSLLSSNQENIVDLMQRVVSNKNEIEVFNYDKIKSNELEYIHEIDNLQKSLIKINKRINNISKTFENVERYHHQNIRKVNRLGISNWILNNCQKENICPFCGSKNKLLDNEELVKLSSLVNIYENEASMSIEMPQSIRRELDSLQNEKDRLTKQIKNARKLLEINLEGDSESNEYIKQNQELFRLFGKIECQLDLVKSLLDDGELKKEFQELQNEESKLEKIIEENKPKMSFDYILQLIEQKTLNRLKTLDVDDDYKRIAPKFSVQEMTMEVADSGNNWHLLTEIGSASNWVSFHIAFTCALQEYFQEQKELSSVPSFVVYDQPSQVYFPKSGHKYKLEDETSPIKYSDEDSEAVSKIFSTLSDSVKERAWQVIVLDHAGIDVIGVNENIHVVEEWRNGRKLIPQEWCEL